MQRRVGLFLIGDSNIVRSDMGYRTGHAVGNARALADIFGVWGTGIIPGKAGTSNNFASSVNGVEKGFANSCGWGSRVSDPAHVIAASLPAWEAAGTKWNLSSRSGSYTVGETVAYRNTAWTYTHATRTLTKAANGVGAAMQGGTIYVAAGTGVTPGAYNVASGTANTYVLSGAGLGAGADGSSDVEVQSRWEVVSDTSNVLTAKFMYGYPYWTGVTMTGITSGATATAALVTTTGAMATASIHDAYFNGPHGYSADQTIPSNSNSLGGFIDQFLMDTGVGMDRRVMDLQDPWTLYTQYATFSTGSGSFTPTVRRLVTPFSGLTPSHTGVISVATSGGPFRPGETITQQTSGATARFVREEAGVLYMAQLAGTITTGASRTWTGAVTAAVCTCSSVAVAAISTNTGADAIALRATPMMAGIRYKDGYYLGVTCIGEGGSAGAATATGPVAIIHSKFVNEKITTGVEQTTFWNMGTQSLREFVGQLFRTDLADTAIYAMFDMIALGQTGNVAFGTTSVTESQKASAYLCIQTSLGQNDAALPDARDALNADGSADTGVASNTQAGHARNWRTLASKFAAWWAAWGGDPDKLCFLAGGMISSPGVDATYASAFEPALESVAASVSNFCYVKGSALLTSAQTRERGLYGNQNAYSTSATYTEDSTHLSPGGFDLFGRLVWDAVAEATGVLSNGVTLVGGGGGRIGRLGR